MMDKTTRWLDPIMLTVDDCFCGPPYLTLFLDQGSRFTSELWNTIATPLGVKLHCNFLSPTSYVVFPASRLRKEVKLQKE